MPPFLRSGPIVVSQAAVENWVKPDNPVVKAFERGQRLHIAPESDEAVSISSSQKLEGIGWIHLGQERIDNLAQVLAAIGQAKHVRAKIVHIVAMATKLRERQ